MLYDKKERKILRKQQTYKAFREKLSVSYSIPFPFPFPFCFIGASISHFYSFFFQFNNQVPPLKYLVKFYPAAREFGILKDLAGFALS